MYYSVFISFKNNIFALRVYFFLIYLCSRQEEAALKEELEKQRQERAEEKFQEWLTKANDKKRATAKTSWDPASE